MQHNIIITGVGGQGVVTLGLIISSAAISFGERAIMSEIHGLAQRGGSVSVDVRIGNYRAPIVPDGKADLIISLEPLEALRAISRAGPSTVVVMGEERLPPVYLGIHRQSYPDLNEIIGVISHKLRLYHLDAMRLAREAGDTRTVNTVMVGYIVGLGLISIPQQIFHREIEKTFAKKYADMNMKAFALGLQTAQKIMATGNDTVEIQHGFG